MVCVVGIRLGDRVGGGSELSSQVHSAWRILTVETKVKGCIGDLKVVLDVLLYSWCIYVHDS